MNKQKLTLALLLIGIGLIGVVSILTMEIPLPVEAKEILEKQFTPTQIKLLVLINPSIMLILAVVSGTMLGDKVKLSTPILEKIIGVKNNTKGFELLKFGILGGLLSGILISTITLFFTPILPQEFIELGENLKPSLAARFLYGGITEEILMRYGFMTFIVWIAFKISKTHSSYIYWIGISISSLLFALGHFPIAFQVVENPSSALLSYIIIGNSVGGFIFGWLYWKKGLESAFIAHFFTHIVMIMMNQ